MLCYGKKIVIVLLFSKTILVASIKLSISDMTNSSKLVPQYDSQEVETSDIKFSDYLMPIDHNFFSDTDWNLNLKSSRSLAVPPIDLDQKVIGPKLLSDNQTNFNRASSNIKCNKTVPAVVNRLSRHTFPGICERTGDYSPEEVGCYHFSTFTSQLNIEQWDSIGFWQINNGIGKQGIECTNNAEQRQQMLLKNFKCDINRPVLIGANIRPETFDTIAGLIFRYTNYMKNLVAFVDVKQNVVELVELQGENYKKITNSTSRQGVFSTNMDIQLTILDQGSTVQIFINGIEVINNNVTLPQITSVRRGGIVALKGAVEFSDLIFLPLK